MSGMPDEIAKKHYGTLSDFGWKSFDESQSFDERLTLVETIPTMRPSFSDLNWKGYWFNKGVAVTSPESSLVLVT
jgi:hypothetical protein